MYPFLCVKPLLKQFITNFKNPPDITGRPRAHFWKQHNFERIKAFSVRLIYCQGLLYAILKREITNTVAAIRGTAISAESSKDHYFSLVYLDERLKLQPAHVQMVFLKQFSVRSDASISLEI